VKFARLTRSDFQEMVGTD